MEVENRTAASKSGAAVEMSSSDAQLFSTGEQPIKISENAVIS